MGGIFGLSEKGLVPLDLGKNVVILPVLITLFHQTITWEEHQDATRSDFSKLGQGVSEIDVDLSVLAVLITKVKATLAGSLWED